MARVLVTSPNLHWVHASVAAALLRIQQDGRHALSIRFPSNKPYENNLHHIVRDFIGEGFDYWLSIDDDNPPTRNPLDLIEFDKDIIGLPTPVWHWTGKEGERPIYLNAYRWDIKAGAYREWMPQEGLQRVDAVGTGCFLIARRVFEDPKMREGPFLRKTLPDGCVDKGNDISFCERARDCGFQIWTHFDYVCDQFTEVSLLECWRAMRTLRHVQVA